MFTKMLLILIITMMAAVSVKCDPAGEQLEMFRNNTRGRIALLTTESGAPVYCKDTSTLNKNLLNNVNFMESVSHVVRERIPERVVHASGTGAFGYFEVCTSVSDVCKANFLNGVGKRTPVAVRFSTVLPERGGIDTSREPRGFAVKFYTEEGNFDIVGIDIPLFAFKDPIKFSSLAHCLKRNPATNLRDPNMVWDFVTLNPESFNFFTFVYGDRGIPDGYRYMPGFAIHTYQVVNNRGQTNFVRFHMLPDLGLKTLDSEEAMLIAGLDPDYSTRDLYNAIGNGNFPTWTVALQILSMQDVKNANFDVFDVTKELPVDKYPLKTIGRLVLDKNPSNNFADIEQLAFSPANLVPGILGAPDKVFEARRLVYNDAHNHRLGANFFNIAVNCPFQTKTLTYNRDGNPPVRDNMRDMPNYNPNSFNGPVPYGGNEVELIEIYEELPNNLKETRERYVNGISADERSRLIDNILYSLQGAATFIQERAIRLFAAVHPDLGERIKDGLYGDKSSTGLPAMIQTLLKWDRACKM